MSRISFSRSSTRSPLKLLAIVAVLAFMTCQTVCLSHCHSSEHSHFEHHHIPAGDQHPHIPNGHPNDHEGEHHREEPGIEGQAHTHLHEHSNMPHSIVPKKPTFKWPEIAVDIAAALDVEATSVVIERPIMDRTVSLLDRYGYSFIGRSPTAA